MLHQPHSFLDVFEHNCARHPEKEVLAYIAESLEKKTVTFKALLSQSHAIAGHIEQQTQAGDRVLLSYNHGLEFIMAFLACLYAGVVAVPVFPIRNNRHSKRFLSILDNCNPQLICGTRHSLKSMQINDDFQSFHYLYTEEIDATNQSTFTKPRIKQDSLAFLQYTSGSTGSPKGVMISHGNIMANLDAIHHYFQLTPTDTCVSWLPMQHDMGLIGDLLYALFVGVKQVILSPTAVLTDPFKWLQCISDTKACTAGGPNYIYERCLEKIRPEQLQALDLSRWNIAYNGSEPIHQQTLEAFTQKFAACGFKREAFLPCYGMAESTLLISAKPPATHYVTNGSLVTVGQVAPNSLLKIVDINTHKLCQDGEVGEIWVSGPSVAKGYWHNKQDSIHTFNAKLADDETLYLRTGDLGALYDNELVVTGRLTDLIILQGQNIYPQDIEKTVESSHPAISKGTTAAFSITKNQQAQLVVVAEINRTFREAECTPIFQAIRKDLIDINGVIPYNICLLTPAQAHKTTSGKIQRKATKAAYLEGALSIIKSDEITPPIMQDLPTQEELISVITRLLKTLLGVETLSNTARFGELGGTSLQAVVFHQQLQAYLGNQLEISASIIFDYPSINALCQYIHAQLHKTHQPQPPLLKKHKASDSIAIISMACRFPGSSNSPEAFWQMLVEGRDGIMDIPGARWDWQTYAAELTNHRGGFIDDIECFAADFFNISPREAVAMDPQQRLLLEVTWEALERAGIAPHSLEGTDTSVFVGATTHEYGDLLLKNGQLDRFVATGNNTGALAGRVSYALGLQGPCMSVDTACSSSLVAVAEACQRLQRGDTSLAIAAGVNALCSPEGYLLLSKANMLSSRGYCQVFSDEADGYVRGEGCGVVLLKRLDDAQRDNNPILAVIKGSAVNQDGSSSGFTVPNGVAQERLIRQALASAKLTPHDIDYIEAHGTGTILGDPMETHALAEVFAQSHSEKNPLMIGSVKANIGHLEAAAGIAGLMKVILSLLCERIPPQIKLNNLSPKIKLHTIPACIATTPQPWPKSDMTTRHAGVSSFGFTGTNAHVIVAEAPKSNRFSTTQETTPSEHLLVLSAKSQTSLLGLIAAFRHYLTQCSESLANICYSAALSRTHFQYRVAFLSHSLEDLHTQLQAVPQEIRLSPVSYETIMHADLAVLSGAYLAGKIIDWQAHYAPHQQNLRYVQIPTYAFERQPYWFNIKDSTSSNAHQLKGELLKQLQAAVADQRLDIIQCYLMHHLKLILKLPPGVDIDPTKLLTDFGVDSLTALELQLAIEESLDGAVTVNNTLAFDYNNIRTLSQFLLNQLQFKDDTALNALREQPSAENTVPKLPNHGVTTLSDSQLQWWVLSRAKLKEKLFHFRVDFDQLLETALIQEALNTFHDIFPDTLLRVSRFIPIAMVGDSYHAVKEKMITGLAKACESNIQQIIYRHNKYQQYEISFFMNPVKILNIKCSDRSVLYITLNHYILDYAILPTLLLNLVKLIEAKHTNTTYIPQPEHMRFTNYVTAENLLYSQSPDFFKSMTINEQPFNLVDYYVPQQFRSQLRIHKKVITKEERAGFMSFASQHQYSFTPALITCCVSAIKEVLQLKSLFGSAVYHGRNTYDKINTHAFLAAQKPLCVTFDEATTFKNLYSQISNSLNHSQDELQLMAFSKIAAPWIRCSKRRVLAWRLILLTCMPSLRIFGYPALKAKCLLTWAYMMSFFNPKFHRKKINKTRTTPIFFTFNIFHSFLRDDISQFQQDVGYPVHYVEQDDPDYMGVFVFFLQNLEGDYELCVRSPLSEELTRSITEGILKALKAVARSEG